MTARLKKYRAEVRRVLIYNAFVDAESPEEAKSAVVEVIKNTPQHLWHDDAWVDDVYITLSWYDDENDAQINGVFDNES